MSADVHDLDEGDWEILLERIAQKNCTPIVGSGAVTGGPPEGVPADKWISTPSLLPRAGIGDRSLNIRSRMPHASNVWRSS